jgi:hypothetical protein
MAGMIQTSTRADRRRADREARKASKLDRKAFAIANRRLETQGKPARAAAQNVVLPKHGSLQHLLDLQDKGKLDRVPLEIIEPFMRELKRRAYIITKRKKKHQLGIGKYWPSGKHMNCDIRGISPKRYFAAIRKAAESELLLSLGEAV